MDVRKVLVGGIASVVTLFVLVVSPSAAQQPGTPDAAAIPDSDMNWEWDVQCVDCPHRFYDMGERSLQLDTAGNPHIAFGGKHLYYAAYDGTAWSLETVDDSSLKVGRYTSLALDSEDTPHISYYDETILGLKYAYWTGSVWNIQVVDSAGQVGLWNSLALDEEGNPHVSYFANSSLKYAYWTGDQWIFQHVDGLEVGMYTSLALDGEGYPHISYFDSANEDLKYAAWTGSDWEVQKVDDAGSVGRFTSIVLDSDATPHVSYYDHTSKVLKYASWTGSSWDIQIVDSRGYWSHSSLAMGANGMPSMSYYGPLYYDPFGIVRQTVRYAHWTGSEWITQTVDSIASESLGLPTSLALDDYGAPHISYYDDTTGYLKYASWRGSDWGIQAVDQSNTEGVGLWPSLALDSFGFPHISYHDRDLRSLKYAHWNGSGWLIQTLDNVGDAGGASSLALDADDVPHISYNGDFDLRYARWTGHDWVTQTVDIYGSVENSVSLAFDSAGNPHTSYEVYTGLKYAYWTGSNWIAQTVDNGYVGSYNSLALGADDYPHIAYYDRSDRDLKYAHWTGHDWNIQIVDGDGRPHSGASLVLDDDDDPHISYQGPRELRYAYWSGSDWITQTVDAHRWKGTDITLVLDADGDPHIGYDVPHYDSDLEDYVNELKLAHWTGNAWAIQTAYRKGDEWTYTYLSIALDANDSPHIGYCDDYGTLMYAVGQELAPVGLDSVSISGATVGSIGATYEFTAVSAPPTATLPITYTWSPWPLVGQGSSQVAYRWTTPGLKTLTMTAANAVSSVSATHQISITDSVVTATLLVDTVGSGMVLLDPPGGIYAVGTDVKLTATPLSGWQFSRWGGDASGTENPIVITVSEPTHVSAHFAEIDATVYLPLTLRY